MAVPSSGKAGSGDTWQGGRHRPLPCLCPRLCFTAPSILCLHGHFLPQYKIAKEIEKLGGALSRQLLLPTMASWAGLLAEGGVCSGTRQELEGRHRERCGEVTGSVTCYSSSQLKMQFDSIARSQGPSRGCPGDAGGGTNSTHSFWKSKYTALQAELYGFVKRGLS